MNPVGHIFFSFSTASRSTQWERGNDPKTQFSFTGDYDAYGQTRKTLSAALPRGIKPPYTADSSSYADSEGGGKILVTLSTSQYAQRDDDKFMVDRTCRTMGYEMLQQSGENILDMKANAFGDSLPITADNYKYKIIACSLNYYDESPLSTLTYGHLGEYGALVKSETLILTEAILDDVYGDGANEHPECFLSAPDWTQSKYPSGFDDALQNDDERLGYEEIDVLHAPKGWYAPSGKTFYDFHIETNPDDIYGLVLETQDVFGNKSTVAYDAYKLLPLSARQYLNETDYLETIAEYDYRVMQAKMITDPNGNRSVFGFSPLGLMDKSGVIGKQGENEGDIISENPLEWKPTVLMEYDFMAFHDEGQPVWVKTIQREQHYQNDNGSPEIIKVEYTDGFGRLLQTRTQAEDVLFGDATYGSSGLSLEQGQNGDAIGTERGASEALNVVVSGWQVYNNKGKVVEQYEPFFSKGFDFLPVQESQKGQKVKMYYDPREQVVRTVNPDGSEQRVVLGIPDSLGTLPPNTYLLQGFTPTPWETYTYDANDLALLSSSDDAANVPSSHHYTPSSAIVDTLGRTVKTIARNGSEEIVMQYEFDIRGNLLKVTDALERIAFQHKYDLKPKTGKGENEKGANTLWTWHIDKGESTSLFDAAFKPIWMQDAKGAQVFNAYDALNRPTHGWSKNNASDSLRLTAHSIYGESASNPEDNNLLGQLWQQYDESGRTEMSEFDFKGNLLSKKQKVISSTELKSALDNYETYLVDWAGLPNILETREFETSSAFDALNRATKITLPENVNAERKEIVPTYNNAGALEKVSYDSTEYVKHIAYNAKGQRLLIAFGNDVMTRYSYDSKTMRLLRQKSEKFSYSLAGNTHTYERQSGTTKQDDGFNFDLAGNIVKILHRVTDCGINGSALGNDALDRNFGYDPLYRLVSATGRESDSQNQNSYLHAEAPVPGTPNANNVRAYTRNYTYDKMGNIQQLKQLGANGFTRDFSYFSGKNTLEKIEDAVPSTIQSFTYDNVGNQITAGANRNYVWNAADLLTTYYNQAGSADPTIFAQYDYNGGGNRVSKLVRTGTTGSPIYERIIYIDGVFEYHILENGNTYEKNYVHIMDDQSRIAMVRIGDQFPDDISESVTYILEDQLGSSSIRLNSTTAMPIDKEEYYPFGDSSLRTFSKKRYRFTGKEKDLESGLYYYGARYYSAWTCRFLSVDPLAKKYVFQSPYAYADNNPIMKNDPTGMGTEEGSGGGSNNEETIGNPDVQTSDNLDIDGGTLFFDERGQFLGYVEGSNKLEVHFIDRDKFNEVTSEFEESIKNGNTNIKTSEQYNSILTNELKHESYAFMGSKTMESLNEIETEGNEQGGILIISESKEIIAIDKTSVLGSDKDSFPMNEIMSVISSAEKEVLFGVFHTHPNNGAMPTNYADPLRKEIQPSRFNKPDDYFSYIESDSGSKKYDGTNYIGTPALVVTKNYISVYGTVSNVQVGITRSSTEYESGIQGKSFKIRRNEF